MIIVIGHKSPDTDSVVAAKMFSSFLEKEGKDVCPAVAGDINKETEFVFSYLKEDVPRKVADVADEKSEFFLVDHNDLLQSVATKEKIYGILDHHLLSGLKTDKTIFFRVEAVGSTSTLIYKIMKERGVSVDKKGAGLLLAGIISDTLNLTSSTTSSEDIDFYYELSEAAGIDAESFAKEMFAAKSDFSGRDIKEIICGDIKEYDFGGKRVVVGVAETTSLQYFKDNEKGVKEAVRQVKEEKGFDVFFFGAVDIVKRNTHLYPAGEVEKKVAEEIFKGKDKGSFLLLEGVSSRKSEIAPLLSKYYGEK